MTIDRLAFFDIDNTLIQSSGGHMAAMLRSITQVYGPKVRIDEIEHHGMTDQEIITRILQNRDFDRAAIASCLQDCMDATARRFSESVESEKIIMKPGVFELISKLEGNGIVAGLVTGNLEKIAYAKLKKIGIDHFFRIGGFGSDHISRTVLVKIAIKRAGKIFDLGTPLRAFHFGDAPQDMRAGREAGVVPIGVATGVFSADRLAAAGAEKVLPDLRDTDKILNILQHF